MLKKLLLLALAAESGTEKKVISVVWAHFDVSTHAEQNKAKFKFCWKIVIAFENKYWKFGSITFNTTVSYSMTSAWP